MCLAIPAQISELCSDERGLAMVDVLGVRRRVNVDLLLDDPPAVGDWVLVHVGFAMSKISAEQADEQLKMLASLGEATAASDEVQGYQFGADGQSGTGQMWTGQAVAGQSGAERSEAERSLGVQRP